MTTETAETKSGLKFFKVLSRDGKALYDGGNGFQYSLPTETGPGDWHRLGAGEAPIPCQNGFHVTTDPQLWYREGALFFAVEAEGLIPCGGGEGDKFVASGIRLLREATASELEAVRIFTQGEHSIASGQYLALGSAQVWAWGTAQVRARGSAQVWAFGSAQVWARGSAQVRASGSSVVTGFGSKCQVTVLDQAVHIDRNRGKVVTGPDFAECSNE